MFYLMLLGRFATFFTFLCPANILNFFLSYTKLYAGLVCIRNKLSSDKTHSSFLLSILKVDSHVHPNKLQQVDAIQSSRQRSYLLCLINFTLTSLGTKGPNNVFQDHPEQKTITLTCKLINFLLNKILNLCL